MPALLANVPEGIVWGRVTAYVTSFVADGDTALPDGTPDAIPLNGTITLTPTVGVMVFPTLTPPQQAVIQSLACPVIGGVLYAPGTTPENVGDRDPGVILVASEQPLGLPDRVQYNVTWALEGARVSPPPVTIDVPSQGTVDLATVIPAKPGPGTVIVVSTVDRERAEDAAAAAEGSAGSAFDDAAIAQGARLGAEAARGAAEAAADTAETAATAAVTAKTLAEGFAGDAETALTSTLAAAVYELRGTGQPGSTTETNNAPVGTYYTDTAGTARAWRWLKTAPGSGVARWSVVHGDTGWRNIGGLITVGEASPTQPTKIRRINDQIYFVLQREAVTIGSVVTILSLPSGWHTGQSNERMYHMGAQGNTSILFRILGTPSGLTGVVQPTTSVVEKATVILNATWATTLPWPTTLPGTPA